MNGELISVVAKDPFVRWFVSRVIAYRYDRFELLDFDLTRKFCLRLLDDPSMFSGKAFVWELPLRPLRYYEEGFIARIIPVVPELPCVLVVASMGRLPKLIERACTQSVQASLVRGAVHGRLYDYRTGEKTVLRWVLT